MAALTTLTAVKTFLVIPSANMDSLITALIARESEYVQRWTARTFPAVTVAARRMNGTGGTRMALPEQPIVSIEALLLNGVEIPASPDGLAFGYVFDESTVYLVGGARFPTAPQSVVCSWTAGYQAIETGFIPAGNAPTLTPTTGGSAVTSISAAANGVALTQVGNAPAAGQYSFAAGVYSFAAADANAPVAMSYYYVPAPVEQAVIELVGMDLKQRDNLGVVQKQMAGEFIAYSDKSMTASVKEMLQPFRRMAPV